jgi:anti-anti-sigma regulatory factor
MTFAPLTFQNGALTINVHRRHDGAVVRWTGTSDTRQPGMFLHPITNQLVLALQGCAVTIDFSSLEFMNSATVGPLVSSIKALDAAAASILLVFSDVHWQRTHVRCMRAIARTLKNVRIEVLPST